MEKTSDERERERLLIFGERISLETSLVLLNSMLHNAWEQLEGATEEKKKELNEEIAMYQNERKMLYKDINTEEIKNKICDVYSPILKAEFAESKKNEN